MPALKLISATTLCLSLLLINTHSYADSTISLNSNEGNAVLFVKGGAIALKPTNAEDVIQIQNITANEAIFDSSSETLYIIDHEQRSISALTKAYVEKLSNTLNTASDILDSMPSEQRDTISGLMNDFGFKLPEEKSASTVLEATSIQEFRGITCQENNLVEAEKIHGQVCITQGNSTTLSNSDYDSLLILQSFLLNIAKQAAPFTQEYGLGIPNLDGIEVDGLLVNSQINSQILLNNEPQIVSSSFVVTSINNEAIDDISLPVGYQSKPLSLSQN